MNSALESCYEKIRPLLDEKNIGFPPEPFSVISDVDEHRQFWRPTPIKVLLLAESHVYTEEGFTLDYKEFPDLESLPQNYVRLVYCLGYGERTLVDEKLTHNRGTPQFWKILNACLRTPVNGILKTKERDNSTRIRNKAELLTRLRSLGVWLQDASIVALYRKGEKPPSERREEIISRCWKNYILRQITSQKPNPYVIVIGEHVCEILRRQPHSEVIKDWVKQPQGCRVKGEFDEELSRLNKAVMNAISEWSQASHGTQIIR